MRSYITVCEAGNRSCHYWISAASLSLCTTQSAANACGQRDGGRGKREVRGKRMDKSWEGGVDVEEGRKKRWRGRDKAKEAESRVRQHSCTRAEARERSEN